MKKETEITIKIQSLLNELDTPAKRIDVVERIGKRLRQANSIETAKEVERFSIKMNAKKRIDDYPV